MNWRKGVSSILGISLAIGLATACTQQMLSPTPDETLNKEKDSWDLVFISDSSGLGVDEIYAEFIEEDLGVEVRTHDFAIGDLSARSVANSLLEPDEFNYNLRLNTLNFAEILPEADIVVYFLNPRSDDLGGDWDCGNVEPYANDCAPETFTSYLEDLAAIQAEIFRIREGSPTIIRAFDSYIPTEYLSNWHEHDVFDECMICWENYNAIIHQAAAKSGIPVAPVFETFNGKKHDMDPGEKGFIASDGIHTTRTGATVIAELLRDLGYEPTQP